MNSKKQLIILFDGDCNLCQKSVQFILKKDKHAKFQLASLQSHAAQNLFQQHEIPINSEYQTICYIENDKIYDRSTAVLKICKHLPRFWKLLSVFLIIPPVIRDHFYHLISRKRYLWWGKASSCLMMTPEIEKRFLDMEERKLLVKNKGS